MRAHSKFSTLTTLRQATRTPCSPPPQPESQSQPPSPLDDATACRHHPSPAIIQTFDTIFRYVWEEPLLPPRLLVRVGPDFLRGGDLHRGDGGSAPAVAAARLQAWGVGRVSSEEAGTLSGPIKLIRYSIVCGGCGGGDRARGGAEVLKVLLLPPLLPPLFPLLLLLLPLLF